MRSGGKIIPGTRRNLETERPDCSKNSNNGRASVLGTEYKIERWQVVYEQTACCPI